MSPPWKPEGYTSVAPYLVVEDAQREIDFMNAAFGAVSLRRFDMPDGSIMHAEVRIDDTVVMLGEAGGDQKPVPAMIHLYVEDVDATWRRALDAGASAVREPERREDDPDRRGGVRSPGGVEWWIGTQSG